MDTEWSGMWWVESPCGLDCLEACHYMTAQWSMWLCGIAIAQTVDLAWTPEMSWLPNATDLLRLSESRYTLLGYSPGKKKEMQ